MNEVALSVAIGGRRDATRDKDHFVVVRKDTKAVKIWLFSVHNCHRRLGACTAVVVREDWRFHQSRMIREWRDFGVARLPRVNPTYCQHPGRTYYTSAAMIAVYNTKPSCDHHHRKKKKKSILITFNTLSAKCPCVI